MADSRLLCDSDERVAAALAFLEPEEARDLCSMMELRSYPAGTELVRDGSQCGFMGFLLSGRLAVRKETAFPGRYTLVAVLEPGALVGGVPAAKHGVCGATVAVMEDAELMVMENDVLERLLAENPALGMKLLERVVQVLGTRLHRAYDRLASLL